MSLDLTTSPIRLHTFPQRTDHAASWPRALVPSQVPTDLSGPVAQRLAALITPGTSGPVVDLDALLLLLVAEHNSGACPRAPLLHPRRLTDGALFNIFNVVGAPGAAGAWAAFTCHRGGLGQEDGTNVPSLILFCPRPQTGATNPNAVSALSDGRAINYLSTSPPGSPPRSTTYRTAATMVATGAFNPAARSLQVGIPLGPLSKALVELPLCLSHHAAFAAACCLL